MKDENSKERYLLDLERLKGYRRWYVIIDAGMNRMGLSCLEVFIYAYLCALSAAGPIAAQDIAKFMNKSKRTVFRALRALADAGLIVSVKSFSPDVNGHTQGPSKYIPLWHVSLGEQVKGALLTSTELHSDGSGTRMADGTADDASDTMVDDARDTGARDNLGTIEVSPGSSLLSKEKKIEKQADKSDELGIESLLSSELISSLKSAVHFHFAGCERVLSAWGRELPVSKAKAIATVAVQKLIRAQKRQTITNPPGLLTVILEETEVLLDSASSENDSSLAIIEKRLVSQRDSEVFCRVLREWNAKHQASVAGGSEPLAHVPGLHGQVAALSSEWLALERARVGAVRRGDGAAASGLSDKMYKLEKPIHLALNERKSEAAE